MFAGAWGSHQAWKPPREKLGDQYRTLNFLFGEYGQAIRGLDDFRFRLDAVAAIAAPTRAKELRDAPPTSASFLLYCFLNRNDRYTIPDDLAEEYRDYILPRFGRLHANVWFWLQTIRTIAFRHSWSRWVVGSAGIAKLAEKLGDWIRSLFGL